MIVINILVFYCLKMKKFWIIIINIMIIKRMFCIIIIFVVLNICFGILLKLKINRYDIIGVVNCNNLYVIFLFCVLYIECVCLLFLLFIKGLN